MQRRCELKAVPFAVVYATAIYGAILIYIIALSDLRDLIC
jgi:hypothetical protein